MINGVPVVQIELKTLDIRPRRAMQQIVDYKNEPGNGYNSTLLCFIQLFIVSNRSDTWYFANNNARHFSFDADERFLPLYQFADESNKKITHLDNFAEKFLAKGLSRNKYTILRYIRGDGVVPLSVERIPLDIHTGHLLVGNLDSRRI
jgi:type I restriction enzyme R subunit